MLLTGGSDNKVKLWDPNLNQKLEFVLPTFAKSLDMKGNKILVGMNNGTIAEYSMDGKLIR